MLLKLAKHKNNKIYLLFSEFNTIPYKDLVESNNFKCNKIITTVFTLPVGLANCEEVRVYSTYELSLLEIINDCIAISV